MYGRNKQDTARQCPIKNRYLKSDSLKKFKKYIYNSLITQKVLSVSILTGSVIVSDNTVVKRLYMFLNPILAGDTQFSDKKGRL